MEMPEPELLDALGLSEPEARGAMVLLNLDKFDGTQDADVFLDKLIRITAESDKLGINDIFIGRSVGAKARNYNIIDPYSGKYFQFVEGTKIQNAEVFAGYGVKKSLRNEVVEGLVKEFGGQSEKWQHAKGVGVLDYCGEELRAEVHWFQEESVGKVKFKVKEWLE